LEAFGCRVPQLGIPAGDLLHQHLLCGLELFKYVRLVVDVVCDDRNTRQIHLSHDRAADLEIFSTAGLFLRRGFNHDR
jgi:hypothetical protein